MSDVPNKKYSKKEGGFTLLELIVVIIIIGILATLGFSQYTLVAEKGRTAEGRAIIGQLRSAEIAYAQEYGTYTASISNLYVNAPTSCTSTHYYVYYIDATGACGNWQVRAVRCVSGGKQPTGPSYSLRWGLESNSWCNDAPY